MSATTGITTPSGMKLRDVLSTLQRETRPIEGHTDPGSIQDCWNEVFETLDRLDKFYATLFDPTDSSSTPAPARPLFWQLCTTCKTHEYSACERWNFVCCRILERRKKK